jgi:pSer/pThr/pTyr-binding forkhead associated (FHA) protein
VDVERLDQLLGLSGEITVARDRLSQLIEDPGASRNHCEIVLGTPVLVRDLNSTNGTFVNGQKISQVEVADGTAIMIGSTQLVFRSG